MQHPCQLDRSGLSFLATKTAAIVRSIAVREGACGRVKRALPAEPCKKNLSCDARAKRQGAASSFSSPDYRLADRPIYPGETEGITVVVANDYLRSPLTGLNCRD